MPSAAVITNEVDAVWRTIGTWDRYQVFQLVLNTLDMWPACFAILGAVFTECHLRGGHIIPSDLKVRAKWISAIKRLDGEKLKAWQPSKSAVVCRAHFKPEDYMQQTLHGKKPAHRKLLPSAVPSKFQWTASLTETQKSRKLRKHDRENKKRKYNEDMEVHVEEDVNILDCTEETVGSIVFSEEIESTSPVKKFKNCLVQTDSDPKPPFGIENVIKNNKFVHFYTGLGNYRNFLFVLHTLGPAVNCLNYLYHQVQNVSIENQFFMTLMKLRRNYTHYELSIMFCVSESSVKNIIFTWIIFMSKQWQEYNVWPSQQLVRYYMPSDFNSKFPSTRVVIDGTECQIKRSKAPKAQQASFSSYKHKHTVKTLVGATPGGLVSYVSSVFAGSTSDRQIVERSKLFNMCDPFDSIMADKGFNVQDMFAHMDVQVNVPSFFTKKNRLSGKIVVHDRKIASKRVHIERIIGLGKTYKVLCQSLSSTETKIASDIIFVCFMLCNF